MSSVDPTQDIDIRPLFPQIATLASSQLQNTPAQIAFSQLGNVVDGTNDLLVNIGTLNLNTPLTLNLVDLQLNGQAFAPNCYGTLTFC